MAQPNTGSSVKNYQYNEKGLPVMTVPVPMPPVKPPREQQTQSSSAQQQPKQSAR